MKPQVISIQLASRLVGISPRRIQLLANSGWIQRTAAGGYTTVGVVQGYIRYLRDRVERAKVSGPSAAQDMRTKEIERRIQERLAGLMRTKDAVWLVDTLEAMFDGLVDSVGAQFPPDAGELIAECRTQIHDACARTRLELTGGRPIGQEEQT